MAKNLFLAQSRARRAYSCDGCAQAIPKGAPYFRHDPLNLDPSRPKIPTGHWCMDCIESCGAAFDPSNGRLRVSVLQVLANRPGAPRQSSLPYQTLGRVELVGFGERLSQMLLEDPERMHSLSAGSFQEFICERIAAMGCEPQLVGHTYQRDGGIDILFWPRETVGFPFLGAIQAKHHGRPSKKEGPASVRDFAGVVAGHPISVGLLVTNTSFTADAKWFAKNKAPLVRLRDFTDIRRWLAGNFADADEWREIPEAIEVCPGLIVPVGGRRCR